MIQDSTSSPAALPGTVDVLADGLQRDVDDGGVEQRHEHADEQHDEGAPGVRTTGAGAVPQAAAGGGGVLT